MKAVQRLAVFVLTCALSWPVFGQVTRLTPDEFSSRFNAVFRSQSLRMRLGSWKPGLLGGQSLIASLRRDIWLIAEQDQEHQLSSILFVMQSTGTLESVTEIVATLAATTFALNPELSQEDREALLGELGFFDEAWSMRGLDGIAVRHGLTYRLIHPGGDALVMALVSWDVASEPGNALSL